MDYFDHHSGIKMEDFPNEDTYRLFYCCIFGDETGKLIRELVSSGNINLEHQDKYEKTALQRALYSGQFDESLELINLGANYKITSGGGWTILHSVCQTNLQIVQKLLYLGEDIETKNDLDETPLKIASKVGFTSIVSELLERRANIDVVDIFGRTPLMYACIENHTKVVKLLLKYGADPNIKDMKGQTALTLSVRKEEKHTMSHAPPIIVSKLSTSSVRELLNYGVDTEVKNEESYTHIFCACEAGDLAVISSLAKSGACLDKVCNGTTPLIHITKTRRCTCNISVIRRMIELGADIFITDEDGKTCLDYLDSEYQRNKIVKYYMEKGTKNIKSAKCS